MPDTYTAPLRRRVESSFASGIRAQLDAQGITEDELKIFEGGGDDIEALGFFLVVACMQVRETTPQAGVFYADIRVSLCCQIDVKTSAEHDAFHKAVAIALRNMPRLAYGDGVHYRGWEIDREESDEEEQMHGDVFFIEAGVIDSNIGAVS